MNDSRFDKKLREHFDLIADWPAEQQEAYLLTLDPELREELRGLLLADADNKRTSSTDRDKTEIRYQDPKDACEPSCPQIALVLTDFAARLRVAPETGLEEYLYDARVGEAHRLELFRSLLSSERSHRRQWNCDHSTQPLAVDYESYWKRDFSNNPAYFVETIGVLIGEPPHNYGLVREIGKGGMGRVLLVQNRNVRDRLEALKVVLLKRVAGEWDEQRRTMFAERFEVEFRALSSSDLVHEPNLAHLYNNSTADGLRYFTMAYVEGQTLFKLFDRVDNRALWKESEIIARMAPLARLIHKLHTGPKLIHRDLHPDNFIWSEGSNRVFLIDFGLARSLDGSDLTQSGEGWGRPGFRSPEQAEDAKKADKRSDVYTFGATLFFLLTGRRPQRAGKPDSFPVDSPRVFNAAISSAMEALCVRALDEDPHKRYQTMEQVADDLERCAPLAQKGRGDVTITDVSPHVNLERDVSGLWAGHECQAEGLPEGRSELPVTLELWSTGSGRTSLQGRYEIVLGNSSFAFDVRGELCFGRFVRFDCRSTDMAAIRFGTYILELNGVGDKLSGHGVGYSAFGERITTATVSLRRTK